MPTKAMRDWSQYDILEETERLCSGPGFFDVLYEVCLRAFGGVEADPAAEFGRWQFPMEGLTVGQLLDFCSAHKKAPAIRWHNGPGGPDAYFVIDDRNLAETFRGAFGIDWLSRNEAQRREDEDTLRASR